MTSPREVVPVIMGLVEPTSLLDVGCGTGTWLKAFEEAGVSDYVGVDGDYVNRLQLNIPIGKFIAKDLRTQWLLNRKFDLVLSLEVAEHLPEASADQFVETLVSHTDNTIIFSAAIPGQGGQNHLNEQWPEYWQQKFMKHGFYFYDVIRPLIWDNEKVDWWYKQNIFLVTTKYADSQILKSIHPALFKFKLNKMREERESIENGVLGIRYSLNLLFKSIIRLGK